MLGSHGVAVPPAPSPGGSAGHGCGDLSSWEKRPMLQLRYAAKRDASFALGLIRCGLFGWEVRKDN